MHTKSNNKNTVKVCVSRPPWPYSAQKQQTGRKCKCSKPTTTKYKLYGKCGGRVGLVGPLMHKKDPTFTITTSAQKQQQQEKVCVPAE